MKNSKKYLIGLIVLIVFVSIAYVIVAINLGTAAEKDTKVKSDAILVLGARSYLNGKYNPCLKARVDHAVTLYKEGFASKIVVSGGDDTEDMVNEAETMKKIAVEGGVNANDIILETQSTSTYENFTLSQKILRDNNLQSVVIVTEPFHMPRAALVAQKLQYDFTVSPAAESPCWLRYTYASRYFLKEPFAVTVYRLQGKL